LLTQAQKLDLYSSSSSNSHHLFLIDNLNLLSKADQDMAYLYTVPEPQQSILVTLGDLVAGKGLPSQGFFFLCTKSLNLVANSQVFFSGTTPSLSASNLQVIQVYTKYGRFLLKYA
jgi:hypothetical protein